MEVFDPHVLIAIELIVTALAAAVLGLAFR